MEDAKLQSMTKSELIEKLERQYYQNTIFHETERIANIGYYEWDFELDRLESCSEGYAHIFNMSVDEVMLAESSWKSTLEEIHPDDLERYKVASENLLDSQSVDIEFRIIRNDGEVRHIREYGVVVENDDGKERRTFGIIQDITDQVEHRQALEYRDSLAQKVESVTDIGHFIFDEKSQLFLLVSPGFASIHGSTPEQYIQKIKSVECEIAGVHDEDKDIVWDVYNKYKKDHKDYSVEYRIFRENDEIRWVRELGSAHRIANGEVELTMGVLQDITNRKKNESHLINIKNSLETTVESRTRELDQTILQLQEARDTLELTVKQRTRELANTVDQLQDEIKEREKIAAELKFLANHDALTGLPSLRLCKDRLDRSLAESRRNQQMSAVMFLDLDHFKSVNDTYGHECGDDVLKITADRINSEIREIDTVARIGGDEFLIILSHISDVADAQRVARIINERISQVIHINGSEVVVGASVGIAIYPADGTTGDELIRQADKAMYLIKNAGK